jgi:hypothetical protein
MELEMKKMRGLQMLIERDKSQSDPLVKLICDVGIAHNKIACLTTKNGCF